MSTNVTVVVTVNGAEHTYEVEPRTLLAPFLRETLGLTGTKLSCDAQICGACTVLVDGRPVSACTTLLIDADGKSVATVEGLANGDKLSPIQEAFVREVGYQCGFCTAGQLMTASWVIESKGDATREEIAELLHGNICRCGAYPAILSAVESVLQGGQKMQEDGGK